MSNFQIEECAICEDPIDPKDDLVITSCCHKFHRQCAENRVNQTNKTDCRICKAPDALTDALQRQADIQGRCSICNVILNEKPNLITTSCQHTFHLICAEKRVYERNRPECRVCNKSMALADALTQSKPKPGQECSICEKPTEEEEDLIVTGCRHTFHRICAENRLNERNKSDCRACQKPHAIADALHPPAISTEGECSICEDPLNHLLVTNCRHSFHHGCVRKLVNQEKKTDCHVCYKPGALAEALNKKPDIPISSSAHNTSIENQSEQNLEASGYAEQQSSVQDKSEVVKTKEKWRCEHCTLTNDPSTNRCSSCGKVRYMRAMPVDETDEQKTDRSSAKSTLARSISLEKIYLYVMDIPLLNMSDSQLATLIDQRLKTFRISLLDVQCYSKLGIGRIRVQDNETCQHLTEEVGRLALNPQDASATILFTKTFTYVSYIVLTAAGQHDDIVWPKPERLMRRYREIYSDEALQSCEQVDIQFPNIYRVVLSSYNELGEILNNRDFTIDGNLIADVHLGSECSYLENVPKSISDDDIREAIKKAIGQVEPISTSDLYIQINKQTNNVCLIASNTARKLSTKSIYLGQQPIITTESLSLCLFIRADKETCDKDTIVQHDAFKSKARFKKQRADGLIVEITDKAVFNECVKRGLLRIGDHRFLLEIYNSSSDPDECEIDADTWLKTDMLRYTADIMKFVPDRHHKIFRLRWNATNWLDEFQRVKQGSLTTRNASQIEQNGNMTFDDLRHRLRVTVMLNTIGIIFKKSYMIDDREIKLNLNPNMQTIIYNKQSTLALAGPMPLKKFPFSRTKVSVVKKDCVVVYEELTKQGKKPLLLNMASATSPGGGYRKGDGAQEENLFRRSDYIRSLDVGLDQYIDNSSERSSCTSTCNLDASYDARNMYPMDTYGAIYTSGLTFFRRPEDEGYAFMEVPLTGVCALAMAAYRDPELDGNMLASKPAVRTRRKVESIFSIAYHHQHDCLVLSALGCGAFRNPPKHIAQIFRSVIEQYAGFFESIVFAIIDDHNTGQALNKEGNFQPFYDELNDKSIEPYPLNHQANIIFGPYRFSSDGVNVCDVSISGQAPCNFGAKCSQMYDPQHENEFSHPPLCIQQLTQGSCSQKTDAVHTASFVHSEPCKHGAQCRDIDDEEHSRRFEHPSFCPAGGVCQNTTETHEKQYRHLPLCKDSHKCLEFKKGNSAHCSTCRHYMPVCKHAQHCTNFHNRDHMNNYKHTFPTPCPWTPYNCQFHGELTQSSNGGKASHVAHQHCADYGHVCVFGRNCHDPNAWHEEKVIHVPRKLCKYADKCNKLNQEDHLNSFTHPNIRDIRIACKNGDKCDERSDISHLARYRHAMTFTDSGVVKYFHLNKDINFVQNQSDNIKRVLAYAEKQNWKDFSMKSIAVEIIDWIRTIQPVHRCKGDIFESIILHGHLMSLEYMDKLSKPAFVANSILQHSQIRQIERLKIPECANNAKGYITALVTDIYAKAGFLKAYAGDLTGTLTAHTDNAAYLEDCEEQIKSKGHVLSVQLNNPQDMNIIRAKTKQIAEASIKLSSNKTGIGYEVDKKLGTNKTIFSILGPHTGHYYGDIVLVLKREILHHPDANFSIQAGTSYFSGNCYSWRPWFGTAPNPKVDATQIDLFHKTKMHASVSGYEYATALELIAVTSHKSKLKPSEVDLDKVLERWNTVDSHEVIEAHLPQLIPLDYIEHIYMPKTVHQALTEDTRKIVDDLFKDCLTVSDKSPDEYKKFIITELTQRFRPDGRGTVSRPIRGACLTIPATNLNDHYVVPLTISQAEEQYRHNDPSITEDSTVYIYWQLMNGDMMLTLSATNIDTHDNATKHSCLVCYVAPKPVFYPSDGLEYHEQISYLNSGQPFEHSVFLKEKRFAGKSTDFYMGCNTDDIMTLCLEIQRATGTVSLYHAGPNAIYNHQKIFCKFLRHELNTKKLEFIHVSAGNGTVPVRNLIVTFKKQEDLHPTFDEDFVKDDSLMTQKESTKVTINKPQTPPPRPDDKNTTSYSFAASAVSHLKDIFFGTGDSSSLKLCPKGINCSIQFSDNANTHNSQWLHACRFAELCRNPEPNLSHPRIPRDLPYCTSGAHCKQICEPVHRSRYVHIGLPFYLIPCRKKKNCKDDSDDHRKKYSHDEEELKEINEQLLKVLPEQLTKGSPRPSDQRSTSVQHTPCRYGAKCRDVTDPQHCDKYSHPPGTEKKDNRIICKYGAKCHEITDNHRRKYSHPST
ncbi:unnamed protein product [Adineta ricciae]|uniref:Uncharacterized protein n=1 Tax=Adineta ricciae TaxID=249248 RepID=A0A814PDK2_ADIRI|nr:unnamed protein product [Adineta ricciae]